MATHFTIPIRPRPCSGMSYTVMPSGLSSYLTQSEYAGSMSRVMAANRAAISTRLLYGVAWAGYMLGLLQLCGLFSYSYDYNGNYYSSYANNSYIGLGVAVVSFVALISLSRFMRKRRAVQVAAAVQLEHLTYATRQPALAWRVVDENHLEIEVVDHHSQQHIAALEHQVHILQAQVSAQQQHQAADHELIAHQAAAHQPRYTPVVPVAPQSPSHFHVQYYPSVAASAAPVVQVVEPVYAQAVYQPAAGSVFAHPPPQYSYAPQPRNDMRAALVQHQY